MPIYRPDYSPRLNPYGALKDITPEDLEAIFEVHRDPSTYPAYRVKATDKYRLFAYVGSSVVPKILYFFVTDDGGDTWNRHDWTFPSDHIMEEGFVESEKYYSDVLFFATRTFTGGGDFPSIETWRSEDLGETWEFAWSLTYEPDWFFTSTHRIFPTSGGVYQVGIVGLDATPDQTRFVVFKDGELVLDEATRYVISIGGIHTSIFYSKYETGFFDIQYNTFLGGQDIYKISKDGAEHRGQLPESVFTVPPTNIRPPLSQIWWLIRKGILYLPTLATEGARLYTSFDEGQTFEEQSGGVLVSMPSITTTGRPSIIKQPTTGEFFRNEAYAQDVAESTLWTEIMEAYTEGKDWDVALERRIFRRGSSSYLWIVPE